MKLEEMGVEDICVWIKQFMAQLTKSERTILAQQLYMAIRDGQEQPVKHDRADA